jgi:hypothetical protein
VSVSSILDQTFKMLSLASELSLVAANSLSVAMETNGQGFLGFIVELPGAFVRGPVEDEALSKAHHEAGSYLRWLGHEQTRFPKAHVVQTHRCRLMVEDADCEILLDNDTREMDDQEFRRLADLAKFSGVTFNKLFDSVELRDWIDEAKIRRTFYGQNKKTIQEIFDHVKQTQYYYLSRTSTSIIADQSEHFMRIRNFSLDALEALFRQNGNLKVYTVDNEAWTLKKILRRFIWHDRIHGKAITRILEKQRQLGLIDRYDDPFRFDVGSKRQ